MPRYDYRCDECATVTEAIYPMAEVPATHACVSCGTNARRLFHPPAAIHFHGPGFHATDVTGRVGRKRRPNPGDSLHRDFDHGAARIAAAI